MATPPDYAEGCRSKMQLPIGIVYPYLGAVLTVPLDQQGNRTVLTFEATHFDADAKIYWHLNDQFLGSTVGIHQFEVIPDEGKHILAVIDDIGQEDKVHFGSDLGTLTYVRSKLVNYFLDRLLRH